MSCGVGQLYGITSDPIKVLYAIATQLYHPARGTPYAFVMWSDTEESNGEKLIAFITELFDDNHLTETDWVENPKTSNKIKVFIWEIPHEELKEWYLKMRVERAKKL